MTEDEAKTKWCPHVVASHTDPRQAPSQYEREAGAASPYRHSCIASACMAWRWFGTHVRNDSLPEPSPNLPGEELVWSNQSYGACGLAGPWFAEMRRP